MPYMHTICNPFMTLLPVFRSNQWDLQTPCSAWITSKQIWALQLVVSLSTLCSAIWIICLLHKHALLLHN